MELLETLDLHHFFEHQQIFPDTKRIHFNQLQESSGIAFEEMLFFDDEPRNIRDVSELGVTAILCEEGISWNRLHHGIETFLRR